MLFRDQYPGTGAKCVVDATVEAASRVKFQTASFSAESHYPGADQHALD
jgi:hypothetical protein